MRNQTIAQHLDIHDAFYALMDSSLDCIKIFDVEGRLLYINKSGLDEHHLKSLDDALRNKWDVRETILPEDQKIFAKAFHNAVQGRAMAIDIRHTKEGSIREACSEMISPLRDSRGDITAILGVSRDMTTITSEAKKLQGSKDLLELRVAQKTEALEKKVRDLERWRRATVGRELEMVKLKKENEALKKERTTLQERGM